MKVAITIDGQMVWVQERSPLIEAAAKLGIHIPTLCHHPALKPYGVCRLCLVEVIDKGRSSLVTSCNYPAREGIAVFTANERVLKARRMALELLLSRCQQAPQIQELARQMGVRRSRFRSGDDQRCILCGLCVRACAEMVGQTAIGFADRGSDREVSAPYHEHSEACIGCGACTYICPTSCIEMAEKPGAPPGHWLNLGDLGLQPCPHEYDCQSCQVDQDFRAEMKRAISQVRSQLRA